MMAWVENIPPGNRDSEMEEGEIVDDLDELSDISSEEEFLLRQRLQVLENYNNVLERKKAKRSSREPGKQRSDVLLNDLSEISGTDLEDNFPAVTSKASVIIYKNCNSVKEQKHFKTHYKQKRRKENVLHSNSNKNNSKKKSHRKRKIEVIVSESSEESDDEYRNKRRKLANAVRVNRNEVISDKSTLQARLQKMICGTKSLESLPIIATEDKQTETQYHNVQNASCSPIIPTNSITCLNNTEDSLVTKEVKNTPNTCDLIDLCTDDDRALMTKQAQDTVDSGKIKIDNVKEKQNTSGDSEEDIELLRQNALNTKISKVKPDPPPLPIESENKPANNSEDEDSDTAELRLICLKSSLLKKAFEMKRKQKLRKRKSSMKQDDLYNDQIEFLDRIPSDNNTDIESVDMDIGSEGDDKGKIFDPEYPTHNEQDDNIKNGSVKRDAAEIVSKEDELEEDEDLLRARLLTSLSKNLPNLVDPKLVNSIDESNINEKSAPVQMKVNVPEAKRIVINLGESDSEVEPEATKNLTKMHMKLSEQVDFQQKLDMFLKTARMEVENSVQLDIVNKPPPNPPQKFVAKTVNHLPKSVQLEYKSLVKKMAELEKMKQARQTSINWMGKPVQAKDTLKPRNVSIDHSKLIKINNLEEQIALSRKKIAEESANILRLKEEATKLSQKYKIVATELKNIATAITLNKKQQRVVHNRFAKMRVQHQQLLNSSTLKHSIKIGPKTSINRINNNILTTNRLQKENDPYKEEMSKQNMLKPVKVNAVNDDASRERLSMQVDVTNDKKSNLLMSPVKIESGDMEKDFNEMERKCLQENNVCLPAVENRGDRKMSSETCIKVHGTNDFGDYESPLQALGTAIWDGDPNAILCPFEVEGDCKDPDCKYLHPKISPKQ